MKHLTATVTAVVFVAVTCSSGWADYGLSNVVQKRIDRNAAQTQGTPSQKAAAQETAAKTPPAEQAAPPHPAPAAASPEPPRPAKAASYVKTEYYAYTIHVSSWQSKKDALNHHQRLSRQLDPVFVTKIDLGPRGLWYRVDYGAFTNTAQASSRMEELKAMGIIDPASFIGEPVPYAVELGVYADRSRAVSEAGSLLSKGIAAYVIKENAAVYRLLVGAYPDRKSARPVLDDLTTLGIPGKLSQR
ncbi:MAG TPA: SPOR domain-containing protein [Deltaproteobacteria bacterium]|nr:SPOR domain-containing protein [Deltaproteobacteria bacterium]